MKNSSTIEENVGNDVKQGIRRSYFKYVNNHISYFAVVIFPYCGINKGLLLNNWPSDVNCYTQSVECQCLRSSSTKNVML